MPLLLQFKPMPEEWCPVVGYEGYYQVSNKGRVRNAKTLRVLKTWINNGGAHMVTFSVNKKRKSFTISRLVAAAFIGPCPENLIVLHGKKGRNYHGVDNLSYGTYKQNNGADRIRDKTLLKGEHHGCAKLNEMQVRVIRRLLESKTMTQKEISGIFHVNSTTIGCIKRGTTWQH